MSDTKIAPYPEPPKRPWPVRPEKMAYLGKETWRGVTPEAVEEFKAAVKTWEQAVAETRKQHEAVAKALLAMIEDAGFPVSRQKVAPSRGMYKKYQAVKLIDALLDMLPPRPPMVAGVSPEEAWLRSEQAREKKREAEKAQAARRDAAVQWLLDRGMVYGADFTADSAIACADDVAFHEAVAKKLAEGGPFSFEGHNCNEYRDATEPPCEGWDGESHRCMCGNRRVDWSGDHISFDGGYVYGEAY